MTDKELFLESIKAYNLDTRPFELRFLTGFKGIASGYFNDVEIAYHTIKNDWLDKTCYFTLQDINRDIVARCENKIALSKSATSDKDIVAYRFIHVDVDPVRPSGIQANNNEVKYAYERAMEIKNFLAITAQCPNPLVVFSGNGTTLDYRLEKPVDVNETNIELVKSFLETLSMLFSDDKADVDLSVYNPARLIKVPGTISAKGSDTQDRPYRYSEIVDMGDVDDGVSIFQIEEVANLGKELKV